MKGRRALRGSAEHSRYCVALQGEADAAAGYRDAAEHLAAGFTCERLVADWSS
jgi:hypothetical protein